MQTPQKTINYRNAKYQGTINQNNQRHRLGILVDDDLSFYVSNWQKNQLSGNTIIYLSHGKYIYGQWKDNQPHGLNIFRIGDTVLVGVLQNGQIQSRILVIFQRFNFIAVLQKQPKTNINETKESGFKVLQSGELRNHNELLNYITLLQVKVPDHYFSLVKFICSIVDGNIKAKPSKSGNCYFGYDEGLAIVFNSNNGVLSVGTHSGGRIAEFGGKFASKDSGEEGNFETKETIVYSNSRPKNQIYGIFQKMHKRSLDFQNSYFYSKVKTLSNVEELLRGKISQIMQSTRKNKCKFTAADLNDSLDYQVLNQNEFDQLNLNRQKVFQSPKNKGIKKTISQFEEGVPNHSDHPERSRTPTRNKSSISRTIKPKVISIQKSIQEEKDRSPIYVKKFEPRKNQNHNNPAPDKPERSLSKNKSMTKLRQIETKKVDDSLAYREKDQKQDSLSIQAQKLNSRRNTQHTKEPNKRTILRKSSDKSPYVDRQQIIQKCQIVQKQLQIQNLKENLTSKNRRQEQVGKIYDSPSPDRPSEEKDNRTTKKLNQSPYRINTRYQDLNERRQRLLNSFRNLKQDPLELQSKFRQISPHEPNIGIKQSNEKKCSRLNWESPCARQKLQKMNSITSKSDQQSNNCLPLSLAIAKYIQMPEKIRSKEHSSQVKLSFEKINKNAIIYKQNTAKFEIKNQTKKQTSESRLIRKSENILLIDKFEQKYEPPLGNTKHQQRKILQRKDSSHENGIGLSQNDNSKTPSRRRQYQYYFD